MSLHRFVATIAALVLALGTTACGDSGDEEPAQPDTEEPYQPSADDSRLADEPRSSDASAASLRGPEGWEFDDSGQAGTEFLFLNPEPDEQDGQTFAANITV
ncbi:MAG: hypothetical protein M3459_05610, partial [Actinomycetota bacterium]|nr:hypothetical protein [Actinomycetota bacterium]